MSSFDSKNMALVTVLTVQASRDIGTQEFIRNKILSELRVVSAFVAASSEGQYMTPYIWRAGLAPTGDEPGKKQQPLMLPAPLQKGGPTEDIATKGKAGKNPREVDLVISNTSDARSCEYMKGMLQRVFREEKVEAQAHAYLYAHIHKGPYPKDLAIILAEEVRADAVKHDVPAPFMRYIRH